MTNLEIIGNENILRGIKEETHTYVRWKQMGFQVQKGEKALYDTKLWKPVKAKQVDENEDENQKMILVKAFLFGRHQVKEVEED